MSQSLTDRQTDRQTDNNSARQRNNIEEENRYCNDSICQGLQGISKLRQQWSNRTTAYVINQCSELKKITDIATAILARDGSGFANQQCNGVIEEWES